MYYIWKGTRTLFIQHKTYICKTNSKKKADWIYNRLVHDVDLALTHKYNNNGKEVWYGYNYIPNSVPTIKSAKKFTKQYAHNFIKIDHKYIKQNQDKLRKLVYEHPAYYEKHFPFVAEKYLHA